MRHALHTSLYLYFQSITRIFHQHNNNNSIINIINIINQLDCDFFKMRPSTNATYTCITTAAASYQQILYTWFSARSLQITCHRSNCSHRNDDWCIHICRHIQSHHRHPSHPRTPTARSDGQMSRSHRCPHGHTHSVDDCHCRRTHRRDVANNLDCHDDVYAWTLCAYGDAVWFAVAHESSHAGDARYQRWHDWLHTQCTGQSMRASPVNEHIIMLNYGIFIMIAIQIR